MMKYNERGVRSMYEFVAKFSDYDHGIDFNQLIEIDLTMDENACLMAAFEKALDKAFELLEEYRRNAWVTINGIDILSE